MSSENVLVVGAGIAGSVTAYWLGKYGFKVTVVERSNPEQKLGQGLEIEEPALDVIKAMGILDRMQSIKTIELGTCVVNEQDRPVAEFQAGEMSPTGALELMRGDMCEVLYKRADEWPNVTYRFDTTIRSLSQTNDKATVELENRRTKTTTTEEYDLVIGADGQRSRVRQMIMGSPEQLGCYYPVGAFSAYFSIPREDRDWPMSRICWYPGRRIIWKRPTGKDSTVTSVYMIKISKDEPKLRAANATGDRQKQKQAFAEEFGGLGWEAPRIIEGMMKTDNFYSDELVQVKLPSWSQHRVVLIGDSCWAPTPFTGEGNQLAIIGGWVLAQELSRNRSPEAFKAYEKRLRPYVKNSQQIPLGGYMPQLLSAATPFGVFLLQSFFRLIDGIIRFVSWTGLYKSSTSYTNESERSKANGILEMDS